MERAVERGHPHFCQPVYQYIPTCDYGWRRLGSFVRTPAAGQSAHTYYDGIYFSDITDRPGSSIDSYRDRHADQCTQYVRDYQHSQHAGGDQTNAACQRDAKWSAGRRATCNANAAVPPTPAAFPNTGRDSDANSPALALADASCGDANYRDDASSYGDANSLSNADAAADADQHSITSARSEEHTS